MQTIYTLRGLKGFNRWYNSDCPKTIFFVIPDSIGNPERFNIRQIMDSRFRRDDSKV